jgi:hypothetical protein
MRTNGRGATSGARKHQTYFMKAAAGGPEPTTMTLTTILPALIAGPVLGRDFSGSVEVVSRLLKGELPGLPNIGFSIIDVRDLVALHILAMTSPAAAGQRFVAAGDFMWMTELAALLRQRLGARAAKVPTRRLPDFILRLMAPFNSEVRQLAPNVGQRREFTTAKPRRCSAGARVQRRSRSSIPPRASCSSPDRVRRSSLAALASPRLLRGPIDHA